MSLEILVALGTLSCSSCLFFFFQAEDGIRDLTVTGVQTCALPIFTISEILGQTIRLDEAADRILREVAGVVRAGRATLLVHDRERGLLRIVAAQGMTCRTSSRSRSTTPARSPRGCSATCAS